MNTVPVRANEQVKNWIGTFGQEYTDRNDFCPRTLDDFYRRTYGVTRRQLNEAFLKEIPCTARILEVGCNTGTQLLILQEMGFHHLHGIEIQPYALAKAKARLPELEFSQGSALAIPYPDRCFDLVFTSGVLIHISPDDLSRAIGEIYRCARTWVWGFEYFAAEMTEINYRGHSGLLWKANYAELYRIQFPDLEMVKQRRVRYLDNDNEDSMFLLRRNGDRLEDRCAR